MTSEQQPLYLLALRDLHTAAGGQFDARVGWWLPMRYGDPAAEHRALRESAGVFDRSYRSRFMITGTDAAVVLDAVFEGHAHELEEARSVRTVALDDEGTITDLVLISRTGGIAYMVTGEPTRRQDTLGRLQAAVGEDYDVRIDDRTDTTCLLSIAGPRAPEAVERYLSDELPPRLPSLHAATFEFHGFRTLAVRTSDLGEDGFEFVVAPAVGQHIIETLREAGMPLVGFEAQEAARVEACVPAFVPDLEPGLSPAEADLDVLLGLPAGREDRILSAVLVDGPERPATGASVSLDGRTVGEVRSSVWSPALGSNIALAVVESRVALPGATLDLGGIPGTIVAKPFYRRRA